MPIGAPELIVVLIIALLILGPKKLPQAGQSLGRGMREFKDSLSGERRDAEPEPIAAAPAERPAEPRPIPRPSASTTPQNVDRQR
jgi:sec-independent protein translocase protein TatA